MRKWLRPAPLLIIGLASAALRAEIGEISVQAGPEDRQPPAPEDHSALWIHTKTRVTLVLRDAKGRRAGVDGKTKKMIEEIPKSHVEVDFTDNPYTGETKVEADERITLEPALGGAYEMILTGLQAGPYEVSISAQSTGGSSQPSKEVEGLISEGQVKRLKLTFDPKPNAQLNVVDAAP